MLEKVCLEKSLYHWWECKLELPLWRTEWRFLKKTKNRATISVCMLSHFSAVQLFAALCTGARQAPLSSEFSRKEYWSGLPCPPLGDLPNPGIKPVSLSSPALAGRFFTTSANLGST